MIAVETQIRQASNLLLHLTTQLTNAVLSISESVKEQYRSVFCAPAVSHAVHLDFETKDAEGQYVTPEGALKHMVLSSISSTAVTAASGTLSEACGIVGMAGVGKTVALQGLAADKDIRARFPDGIQYMSLGQEATVQTAIQEVARAMTLCGASETAAKVENSTSLKEAVAFAFTWFQEKECLLLIDDKWPTEECPTGFLTDLRQLLRESPRSRMAISTRSVEIAYGAGLVVDFGAREPLGAVSVNIFMKYAQKSIPLGSAPATGDALLPSVTKILQWCAGLPIALSVSGSAVALLVRNVGSLEMACEIYANDFEERAMNLSDKRDRDGSRLSDGILLSLKYLQVEFSNWKERESVEIDRTIRELYTSLCVLMKQLWVPISVLGAMWNLDEKSALDIANLFVE